MSVYILTALMITGSVASGSWGASIDLAKIRRSCKPLIVRIRLNISKDTRDLIPTENIEKAASDGDTNCYRVHEHPLNIRETLTYAGIKYGPLKSIPNYEQYLGDLAELIWGPDSEFKDALRQISESWDPSDKQPSLSEIVQRKLAKFRETTPDSFPSWYAAAPIRPAYLGA